MFNTLCKRIVASMGTKVYSFEDLERLDIDSVDSLCISDSSSVSSKSATNNSTINSSVMDKSFLEEYARRKVVKNLKSIQTLEKHHKKQNESKLAMLVFMDLIRDQQYRHVSMSALSQFIKTCKMVPKQYYLHYYLFFLYYAYYYHHIRATTDVIDDKMKQFHINHLLCIKYQLKYLQYIIKQSRLKDLKL